MFTMLGKLRTETLLSRCTHSVCHRQTPPKRELLRCSVKLISCSVRCYAWQRFLLLLLVGSGGIFYNIELHFYCKARVNALLSFITEKIQRCHFVPSMKRLLIWPMIQHRIQGKDTVVQIQKSVTKECTWLCWTNSSIKSKHALQTLITRVFFNCFIQLHFKKCQIPFQLLKGYGQLFESDRLKSELQVLYSDRDFHTGKDKLCDFIAFFKQGGLDKGWFIG